MRFALHLAAIGLLACLTLVAGTEAQAQSAPLTDAQVQAGKREEARKRREIAESGRSDGIATWEIVAYANDWAYQGAYPDFIPNANQAIAFLEQKLLTYRGSDRALIENNLAGLRRFAAELDRDQKGAAANEMEGLYQMARRYNDDRRGVVRNKETAMRYYSAAAAKGHAHANYVMGLKRNDEPGGRLQAIAYMQAAHRYGDRSAANWLKEWGAPLSPQHAAATAAQVQSQTRAAATFTPGTFRPLFWGNMPSDSVRRTIVSTDELRPLLEQVKAGKVALPPSTAYRPWGLGLGTSPTRAQFLASANSFDNCITKPVTQQNVMGMDLSQTARVRYEEWSAGNRRAVYIQCAIGNAFFEGGANNWIINYLIDDKLVAVQAVVAIFAPPTQAPGDRILCPAATKAPAQLVAAVQRGDKGWQTARAIALSKTPISGVKHGHWYTLNRPGAVMHVFTRSWAPTIEGTSSMARCGSGYAEYLIVTPAMNSALQIDGSRLPELRIGRPASL